MAYRLIEIVVPARIAGAVEPLIGEHPTRSVWRDAVSEGRALIKVVMDASDAEALLNVVEERYGHDPELRIVILPVEALLPRPVEVEPPQPDEEVRPRRRAGLLPRVSREELYARVTEGLRVTRLFLVLAVLSSIVAAVGLYQDNVAVIIGAMVIAPLLGPNVALALSTTLADARLARRAFAINLAGVSAALAGAVVLGVLFPADPSSPELARRTVVSYGDIALALVAGAAGALAFTTGVSAALVGVMVAVALMPPLVAVGLFLGGGLWDEAYAAALLTGVNVICINLAGTVIFLLQGVQPLRWWEAERARRATLLAISLWALLLAVLALLVHLA